MPASSAPPPRPRPPRPERCPRRRPGPVPTMRPSRGPSAHGDEHVIKFAGTAADVHARTGSPAALAAAPHAVELIPRPD